MPSLKLPSLFRRDQSHQALKERAADLKADLGQHVGSPQAASEPPLPPAKPNDDTELLRLGHQFEAARAREAAAIAAWTVVLPAEDLRLEADAADAGDAAATLAHQLASQPALTAEGFRVKLRVLSHYRRNALLSEICDLPDPDQSLSHSLWRDMQRGPPVVDDGRTVDIAEAERRDR